jgi:energy-converting hydrogenase Eha subunit E
MSYPVWMRCAGAFLVVLGCCAAVLGRCYGSDKVVVMDRAGKK